MKRLLAGIVLATLLVAPATGQVQFIDEQFEYDVAHAAAGHWIGEIPGREGAPAAAISVLVQRAESGWSVSLTFLAAAAVNRDCTGVAAGADGQDIAFDLSLPPGPLHFEATVSADGQRLRGTMDRQFRGMEPVEPMAFELARTPRPLDLDTIEAFTGTLEFQGMGGMEMTVALARTPGGHYVGHVDVPAQMLKQCPLINISERDDGVIEATLPVPNAPASFELTRDESGRRLTGQFQQGPFTLELDMKRDESYAFRDIPRPQHPEPPYPYEERSIRVSHPDGFVLAGTLTIPDVEEFGPGPHPCAVLISGSGQQDRDESIMGHKPFLVIADYLTRRGIAVMRYDDRGAGESGGQETVASATSLDFAGDAQAVVRHLRREEGIDPKGIGLIGHSEGGLIAPLVATSTDGVSFIVLMAGPGVPGIELLPLQVKLMVLAFGADPEEAETMRVEFERGLRAQLDGDEEAAQAALKMAAEAQARAMGQSVDEAQFEEMLGGIAQEMTPWMRYFLEHDPAPVLRRVRCPVLAINGTLDLQVWHEQNLDAIEKTLKDAKRDVTVKRYVGLNHLFQPATSGSVMEYAGIETTFDEQVLRDMVQWIKKQQRTDDAEPRKPSDSRAGRKVIK